jgi:hypothetical protein
MTRKEILEAKHIFLLRNLFIILVDQTIEKKKSLFIHPPLLIKAATHPLCCFSFLRTRLYDTVVNIGLKRIDCFSELIEFPFL